MLHQFKSAANSPNRVFLNSQNDAAQTEFAPNNPYYGTFSRYRINLQTPVLNPNKCMLVRSAIPTTNLNIPDYMGYFAIYVVPDAGGVPNPTGFVKANLRWFAFRPYAPNLFQGNLYDSSSHNRPIASYTDFVAFLNALKTNRATNTYVGGPPIDPIWSQFTFALDSVNSRIQLNSVAGGTLPANSWIVVPGYNDPNLASLSQDLETLYGYPNLQQFNPLSLRVGFTSPDTVRVPTASLLVQAGTSLIPQGFPNLVYTQNVYLYSSIVAGSSTTSTNRQNLLGIVDMAVPPLGVSLFDAQTIQFLDTRVKEIFEIGIEMRDDNDQPYNLPDNSIVNVELSFYYTDVE